MSWPEAFALERDGTAESASIWCDHIAREVGMETVGIRDLKTHLSRHLKRVRSGTRLLITEHGRSIATISPWGRRQTSTGRTALSPRVERIGAAANRRARAAHRGSRDERPRRSSSRTAGDLCLDTSSLVKLYMS
jgi:prevent-host-death family protein